MFPPNFGVILPSNLISGQKPQIHTAECTNLCVYTELSRAPYNIHRSPVFIFSQILILFLLRKFDPIPVVSVFMSLPCQTRSCSCPPTCPRCLFDSSCIRRERASSSSSPAPYLPILPSSTLVFAVPDRERGTERAAAESASALPSSP